MLALLLAGLAPAAAQAGAFDRGSLALSELEQARAPETSWHGALHLTRNRSQTLGTFTGSSSETTSVRLFGSDPNDPTLITGAGDNEGTESGSWSDRILCGQLAATSDRWGGSFDTVYRIQHSGFTTWTIIGQSNNPARVPGQYTADRLCQVDLPSNTTYPPRMPLASVQGPADADVLKDTIVTTTPEPGSGQTQVTVTVTLSRLVDSDCDGSQDTTEIQAGTDWAGDADHDGLQACDEIRLHGTDPNNPDSDGDGLGDGQELGRGTNPNDPDSDDDGWGDFDEVNQHGTDPTKSDTDGDGQPDPLDPFPTDPSNGGISGGGGPGPGPAPELCARPDAKSGSWRARFAALVDGPAFLDVDLFSWEPRMTFCYVPGVGSKVLGGTSFGDLHYGLSDAALELLGFSTRYDSSSSEFFPTGSTADFRAGQFQMRWNAAVLFDKLGIKKKVEKYATEKVSKSLHKLLATGAKPDKILKELRVHLLNLKADTLLEYDKAVRQLGKPLPDKVVTWMRGQVRDQISKPFDEAETKLTLIIGGANSAPVIADKLVAELMANFEALLTFDFVVWQPELQASVSDQGKVTYRTNPHGTEYKNPFLTVRRESVKTQTIAKALSTDLKQAARAATRSDLGRSGFTVPDFDAPGPGTASLRLAVPPAVAGQGAQASTAKWVVLGKGSRKFTKSGSGAIQVKLTAPGRKLLRTARKVPATLMLIFKPRGGEALTRSAPVRVR